MNSQESSTSDSFNNIPDEPLPEPGIIEGSTDTDGPKIENEKAVKSGSFMMAAKIMSNVTLDEKAKKDVAQDTTANALLNFGTTVANTLSHGADQFSQRLTTFCFSYFS